MANADEYRVWTDEADAELRRLAPTGTGARGIAVLLKRTRIGVLHRASKLRISIKSPLMRDAGRPTTDQVLRSRWLGLIGPMKARLRAEVEHSAPTPRL